MTNDPSKTPATDPFSDDEDTPSISKGPIGQFGISAIFWVTFMIALSITYLQRSSSSPNLLIEGVVAVAIGIAVGAIIGAFTKQLTNTIIWSTLIAAFGFICVSADSHFTTPLRITWATVGAFSGSVGASVFPNRFPLNAIASAVAAAIVMCIYLFLIVGKATSIQMVDAVAAPIIGFLVGTLIQLLGWMEEQKKISRYFMATLMMVMIIIGSLFVGGLGS